MSSFHYRNCNLCEAMCGIEIGHEDGRVLTIRGDDQDQFSRGHICPKAVALKDIYEDPDRLRTPIKKTADGWQEITWNEAFDEVAKRLKEVQSAHGRDAIAVYQGNPSVHNLGTMLNSRGLLKALKTKNNYSATSVDQLPHHFASWAMFGHPFLIPIPDIDRTDFMLILGANPLASNGSLMTAPDVANRLREIQKRDGSVVVVDPRRTETAKMASEHFFIHPGTDVYLLLSLINVMFAENLIDDKKILPFCDGVADLRELVEPFTPEAAETETGIAADSIRQLARQFAGAKSAVCYGRMGVSVQKFGGLCQWLINCLNIITGNFDESGGAMFTSPAFDILAGAKSENIYNRWQSRVRGLPEFMGELPVAVLAEEILTDGAGQVRALVTSCGNPVLSTPNGRKLEAALERLEFVVCIDIYLNETTRHADIILPPATGLENPHFDIIFNSFAVRNVAKYSPALFPKAENARFDWEIFQELSHRLTSDGDSECRFMPPEAMLDGALRFGKHGMTLEKLAGNPHGVDFGPLESVLPQRLMTPEKRIDLVPLVLVSDLKRLDVVDESDAALNFALIGRRHLRDCNSWMHNSMRLMKGKNRCTLLMNYEDAVSAGLENGQNVRVKSVSGEVELPLEITENVARGVVSIPHGYGHDRPGTGISVAESFAGVSINDLTDEMTLDDLTGNAAFSNVRVSVTGI